MTRPIWDAPELSTPWDDDEAREAEIRRQNEREERAEGDDDDDV